MNNQAYNDELATLKEFSVMSVFFVVAVSFRAFNLKLIISKLISQSSGLDANNFEVYLKNDLLFLKGFDHLLFIFPNYTLMSLGTL